MDTIKLTPLGLFSELKKSMDEQSAHMIAKGFDDVNHRFVEMKIEIAQLELKMERRFNTLLLAVSISILMPLAVHFLGH